MGLPNLESLDIASLPSLLLCERFALPNSARPADSSRGLALCRRLRHCSGCPVGLHLRVEAGNDTGLPRCAPS